MSKSTKAGKVPFIDDYLPALLAQASNLISAEFHRVVIPKGFSIAEWRVLATLAGAPPTSTGNLARMTSLKQPTLTRLLDRMEERGHVKRTPHEVDRRVTLISISASGERLVASLIELALVHERRVLKPLGAARAAEMKSMLKQMIELHRPALDDSAVMHSEEE
jgi:Transcriptional regulators